MQSYPLKPCHTWLLAAVLALAGLALPALAPRKPLPSPPSTASAQPLPSASASAPPPSIVTQHRRTVVTDASVATEIYPPISSPSPTKAPVTLVLTGLGTLPLDLCDRMDKAGRTGAWMLCPQGSARGVDYFGWVGPMEERLTTLDADLAAVEGAIGPNLDRETGDVVVGFSRGAYLARDYIFTHPGRFVGVAFLAASMKPDPAKLKAMGIRQALYGAGDYDGSYPILKQAAAEAAQLGLKARFISLGRRGHEVADDLDSYLLPHMAWLRGLEP